MNTNKLKNQTSLVSLLITGIILLNACRPIKNFTQSPVTWQGNIELKHSTPMYDATKKSVLIIADSKTTEMFDMLAPFNLFNATEKANVYIIAKDKTPILIKRDLFVCPQLTFHEADSMKIQADVIVMPALSIRDEHQDTIIINWIKSHVIATTRLLAICDGASTAAATGLYDGKPITCHASDFAAIKSHFSKPNWVQNVSAAKAGNLFSTAGVSNATEGSLLVINEMFGNETAKKLMENIHYPHAEIRIDHKSVAINTAGKFRVLKKIMFKKNKKIGLLLQDGINEFVMASILDTYSRTFPASFSVCNPVSSTFKTKYGLQLICTSNTKTSKLDELHLLMPGSFSEQYAAFYKGTKLIKYENLQNQYPIDICLDRISKLYGHKFGNVVRISLDYN